MKEHPIQQIFIILFLKHCNLPQLPPNCTCTFFKSKQHIAAADKLDPKTGEPITLRENENLAYDV